MRAGWDYYSKPPWYLDVVRGETSSGALAGHGSRRVSVDEIDRRECRGRLYGLIAGQWKSGESIACGCAAAAGSLRCAAGGNPAGTAGMRTASCSRPAAVGTRGSDPRAIAGA